MGQVTCYEHPRSKVEQAGGHYCTEQAVRDGNMVTGQTWQSHPEFYRAVFACLTAAGALRLANPSLVATE